MFVFVVYEACFSCVLYCAVKKHRGLKKAAFLMLIQRTNLANLVVLHVFALASFIARVLEDLFYY